MTEDEAFVRAVVDSPGDDLPRLVYADWLHERNDPRGAYLRAELEWAKAKQTAGFIVLRLNGLAEGLDPVWVARVSRPPVGVCCDHIDIAEPGPRLALADLSAVKGDLGGRELPSELAAFLLNYNGGIPNPGDFDLEPHDIDNDDRVARFTTLMKPEGDYAGLVDGTGFLWWQGSPPSSDWLRLAEGTNLHTDADGRSARSSILISTAPPTVGAVYHWSRWVRSDPSYSGQLLAPTLGRFLATLGTATNWFNGPG